MTSYACNNCGKTGTVPDAFAGRMGTCPKCGQPVALHSGAAPAPTQFAAQQHAAPTSAPPVYSLPSQRPPAFLPRTPPQRLGQFMPARPASTLTIASFVMACISLPFAWVPICGLGSLPISIIGLIVGIAGWSAAPKWQSPRPVLAVAAILLNLGAILLTIAMLFGYFAFTAN